MSHLDIRKINLHGAPIARVTATFSRSMNSLSILFQPRDDLNALNERLRRDAGLDEQELERANIARAPLIRW